MIQKENLILKNLGIKVEALEKKIDGFGMEFEEKVRRVERRVDARMLLIVEKMSSLAKKTDERMDRLEESNRKNGILLEKLDGKFDLSIEGYTSLKERSEKLENHMDRLEGRGAF